MEGPSPEDTDTDTSTEFGELDAFVEGSVNLSPHEYGDSDPLLLSELREPFVYEKEAHPDVTSCWLKCISLVISARLVLFPRTPPSPPHARSGKSAPSRSCFARCIRSRFSLLLLSISLVVGLLAVILGFTVVGYRVMTYPAKMSKEIADSYVKGFKYPRAYLLDLFFCFCWILAANLLKTIQMVLPQILAAHWRRVITADFQRRYFDAGAFYSVLVLDRQIDNPDERIASDMDTLTTLQSSLLFKFLTAMINIVWYSYTSWSLLGWSGPTIVYVFFVIGLLGNLVYSLPLVSLWYRQEKLEGDFRFAHTTLRDNAESVMFYDGSEAEFSKMQTYMGGAVWNQVRIALTNSLLLTHTNLFGYIGGILNYVVIALCAFVFHNFVVPGMTAGDVIFKIGMSSLDLLQLLFGFTNLIQMGQDFAKLHGIMTRVVHFDSVLLQLQKRTRTQTTGTNDGVGVSSPPRARARRNSRSRLLRESVDGLSLIVDGTSRIDFVDVTIKSPSGHPLLRSLNFSIEEGLHTLIMGPSGSGKTSLLRVLGGIWPYFEGRISRPSTNCFFYIPQRPYTAIATLRELVTYPGIPVAAQKGEERSTDDLSAALARARLGYLESRVVGWDTPYNWTSLLSQGEKQRIAFARLYLREILQSCGGDDDASPGIRYVILDEGTSSLDLDIESEIMEETLRMPGVTVVSVAHRPSVARFHRVLLKLDREGGYSVEKLPRESEEF